MNRHKSRELAIQLLYAQEIGEVEDWRGMLENIADMQALDPEIKGFAKALVEKTIDARDKIDELVRKHAANWELKRMAAIDRNILRLAVAELFYFPSVPYKVIIDEAIELAKKFGTDESGKFVNGVLDSIGKHSSEIPELRERKV